MTLILIIFLILMYFFFHSLGDAGDYRKPYIIIIAIILILLSGLRHERVGNDTLGTMLKFEYFSESSWRYIIDDFWMKYTNPNTETGKDPGEEVYDKLISYIVSDSRSYLFSIAIFVISSVSIFIYKHARTLHAVMFSYIFYVTMFYPYIPNSSARQSLAVAILLFAYNYLMEQKVLKFFLLLILASTLHKSVLVAGIVVPAYYIKNVKLVFYGCLPFFLLMLFSYNQAADILGATNDVYEGYLSNNFYSSQAQARPFVVIIMVAGIYLYNVIILERDQNIEQNKIYYIGTALTLVFTPLILFDPSSLRLIAYFGLFVPICSGNQSNITNITRNGFIAIIIIFALRAARQPDDGYRFMWQEKELNRRQRVQLLDGPNIIDINSNRSPHSETLA